MSVDHEILSLNVLQDEYKKLYTKNKELLDSIYYAESVQQGVLPNTRHFERLFKDYFVLYKPQGIIGGDLYWVGQKGNTKYFAVGDCTGHGVSGAILSVMALSFLNYIVLGKDFKNVGDVLKELDKKWIETFHQGVEYGYNNDWMEIGICAFNEDSRELQYCGAMSSLYYITNGRAYELPGNNYPIGGWQLEENRVYETHSVILTEDASLYLCSDGFKDQFGGPLKKRFKKSRVKELINSLTHFPMAIQKQFIEKEFDCWKGIEEQTDDVCLVGIHL